MNSLHHLFLLGFRKSSTFKNLTISCHLNHSLAFFSASSDAQTPPLPQSAQDIAKWAATQSSNCTTLRDLNQIYAHIICSDLLHFYSAPFHWNNIIRSYTRLDAPVKALQVYISMSRAGVLPDSYTLPIVLKAACQIFSIEIGKQLQSVAIRLGLESNEYCESGFISFYSKSGDIKNAYKMFEENPERKLGSWNAIIGGLSQGGHAKEAIEIFIEMRKCGFVPDDVTMVSVISACGSLGDLNLAIQLHKYVFHANVFGRTNILVMNSLIDMYGKCGRMDLARRVFCTMGEKNVSSWTSMIVGYGMHGHVNEAIEYFHCMREAGVRPNHVTFIGVLSVCVHGGKEIVHNLEKES
ncbi:pentatricopeptide repeat-containing protein, putative [Ricinus communis]|uniref:Pentatricopeptide repeat-containing protein, putative n=1 Tax=Ricinus communis TaxID=3988 RepID=B9RKJ1_RICCO|nr:pentatricopeptide repeat-containing protein, putative [Ricinus communis]